MKMMPIHLIIGAYHNMGIFNTEDMLRMLEEEINSFSGNQAELFDVFYKMANVHIYKWELDQGKRCLENCKITSKEANNPLTLFKLKNLEALLDILEEDFKAAMEGALEQMKLAKENDMDDLMIYPYSQLAEAYLCLGFADNALEYAAKALDKAEEYEIAALEKNLCASISDIYRYRNNLPEALQFLGRSEKITCENSFSQVNCLISRASFLMQSNRHPEAEAVIEIALEKANNLDEKAYVYKLKCMDYCLKTKLGLYFDLEELNKLWEMASKNRFLLNYYDPLPLIAEAYESRKDYRSANDVYKKVILQERAKEIKASELKEMNLTLDIKLKQAFNDNIILRQELNVLKDRNAKLISKLAKTRRMYEDLKVLQKAAEAMTSTMNPDRVLDLAYDYAYKLMPIDFMAVGIYDHKSCSMDYVFVIDGTTRIRLNPIKVTPKTLEKYLLGLDRPKFIEDMIEFCYKRFKVNKTIFGNAKNIIIIPLMLEKTNIGFMGISSDCEIVESGEKIKAFKILSSHLAAAVTNAKESKRLAKEFRIKTENQNELKKINDMLLQISRLDGLTGLYNKHALFRDITDIIDSSKSSENICAIMVDIDYFKEYNDHYGHLAGDAALKKISAFLLVEDMGTKRIYRYGGDEILIIVEGIKSADQACSICKNIVEGIFNLNISHNHSQTAKCITVTVGAAVQNLKNDKIKYNEFLNKADHALYKAKKKGKNCYELLKCQTG